MIPEEFVIFETAKLLKEAGFPQDIKQTLFYNEFGQDRHMADGYYGNRYAAPTQSQAMRWLRDEKDIFVDIENRYGKGTAQWDFKLVDIDNMDNILKFAKKLEYTYEAAVEAGIKAACKYIIKHIADTSKKIN